MGATYLYVNGRLSLTLPGGGGSTWGSDYFNAGGSSGGSGGEAGGWGYRDCGGSGGKGGNSLLVRAGPRLMESQFLATTAQDTGREEAEHREDVMVTEVALVDMGRQVL